MVRSKKCVRSFCIQPDNEKAQFNLRIFDVLKKENVASVQDVGAKAEVSGDIVAEYVNSCVKKDLLKISSGHNGDLVEFTEDGEELLGIGFCGEKCVLTVMGFDGSISSKESVGIDELAGERLKNKDIKKTVKDISAGTDLKRKKFRFAGLAIPENLSEKVSREFAEEICGIFGCDVLIVRETTAAGYAEKDQGSGGNGKSILYMHSDVGSGVVIRDETIYETNSPGQSKNGDYLRPWRQFSIAGTAKSLVERGVGTSIVNMVNGDVGKITTRVVLEAAAKQDELAEDLVKRSALALGVRIAYMANIFGPDIVVIGGGVEQGSGDFVGFAKESAKKFLLKDRRDKLEIVPGALGENVSSIGAASLCRRELFMEG